jgi:hypothetical protein
VAAGGGAEAQDSGAPPEALQTVVVPPAWVSGLEAAFPDARYIARLGYGAERQAAQTNAAAAVAAFFDSEVRSRITLNDRLTAVNGTESTVSDFNQSVFIDSQASLFTLRYTEPWKNPESGEWAAAAYLDRNEAWTVYQGRLDAEAGPLMAAYNAAETEQDALRQAILYDRSAALVKPELQTMLEFARILNPRQAAAYTQAWDALAQARFKAGEARAKVAVYFIVENDMEGIVSGALAGVFSANGFAAAPDEALSTNWCRTEIRENRQDLEAGTFYAPSLQAWVYGSGGLLFSFNAAAERQGARSSAELAQRRA